MSNRSYYLASLFNSGATCYLNSALQGISSCPLYFKDIKSIDQSSEKLKSYKDLLEQLNSKCSFNPSKNKLFQRWTKSGQQDSFELLSYIINEVYDDIRTKMIEKDKKYKKMSEWINCPMPMRLMLKYKIVCNNGHTSSSPDQADLALHVPIIKGKNLQELVDQYFRKTEIRDFMCDLEECKLDTGYRVLELKEPLPNTLCIQLQRSKWNGWRMEKINRHVSFNDVLEIGSIKYGLRSIIAHSGSVYFGHYVCYKKLEGTWYCANDSSVREVKKEFVFNKEAYLLFYEKIDMTTSL